MKNVSLGVQRVEAIIFLVILSPLANSWQRISPSWDDTFFLHNGLCLARSFWEANLNAIDICMSQIAKSPIMAVLLIPAGPIGGRIEGLSVAPFVLSLAIATLILVLHHFLRLAKVPYIAILLAASFAITTSSMRSSGAPFMVDGLLAIVVACTIAFVFVEYENAALSPAQSMKRGMIWAFLITIGMLSKTTYAVIALLVAPIAIWISILRSGLNMTVIKLFSLMVFSIPLVIVLIRYGDIYLAHAKNSSFGPLSSFYNDGLSPFRFILDSSAQNWSLWVGILLLLIFVVARGLERERAITGLLVALVILVYFVISSTSPNKDPRFFWLVWVTLPFCAACSIAPQRNSPLSMGSSPAIQFLCALLIAIPAVGRLDLEKFRTSVAALASLPENATATAYLATDSAHFNIETLLLAQQLEWKKYSQLQIRTVVYDVVSEKSPQKSLERLASADYVLGQFPVPGDAPDWANRYASVFEQSLRASDKVTKELSADSSIHIFAKQAP
ncbi:hypothetical protein J2766_003023 [Agrobacterium tumefaciens]|uniref:Glycosyltransferase RgtA/B/C/D-like domain-containing protein n=1 Tax=Agrobacterium tumefaciens TaxID=358 RepID=A0AAW8LY70_AGRTU|nr:hypothetical protein [Agrobacterium tumefaciens]MBP2566427.1 hypothetical protein [Agrobacterium tumefaciens]MDR6703745.1 hypothetical protein [Agrobacterium tumefaciens]